MESAEAGSELSDELRNAIIERDKKTKIISDYLQEFINSRDAAIKAGLVPEFSKVNYLFSRIEESKAVLQLMNGYKNSHEAMIELNQATKKAQYLDAALGFKLASEAFSECAELTRSYFKSIDKSDLMEGTFIQLYLVVDIVDEGAKNC